MNIAVLSAASLEKLKCGQCSNYLSHFPIRACAEGSNICGRCPLPEGVLGIENLAFQTLSQFMMFPCRYRGNGCEEEKLPKDVPSHEKNCPFRVISCPMLKMAGCDWKGPSPQILQHCKTAHSDLYLQEDNILDLSSDEERHHLLEHEGLLMVCRAQYDVVTKVLNFDMFTTDFEPTPKSYSCNLKVKDDKHSISFDFFTTSYDETAINQLNLESFSNEAVLQVTVGDVVVDPNEYLDTDMLSLLKCFVCQNYAAPPIYHCVTTSEVLCSSCTNSHQKSCAPCSKSVTSTRNISLDKMGSHLNFPCRNRANGCPFVSKPDQLHDHHDRCELGPVECPLAPFSACQWRGLVKEMSTHLQGSHQVLTNQCEISEKLAVGKVSCSVIKYSGSFFRVVCQRAKEKYFWSVQNIGGSDEFKYEIEIVDPVRVGRRLMVRQQCDSLSKKEDVFQQGKRFCYFFSDQVRDFVVNEVLAFRIRIFV